MEVGEDAEPPKSGSTASSSTGMVAPPLELVSIP